MEPKSAIEKKYIKIQKISEGSYGVVYRARNIETQQIVAIKKFKRITTQGIPVGCVRQLNILNLLKQCQTTDIQRTLRLYQVHIHKQQIQMVVQWLDQTLDKIIQKEQYDAKKLFRDILRSALQLHENFIIHRDIKPQNIMICNAAGIIKIIDYGMAKQFQFQEKPMTNEVGSLYYRAPQLLLGSKNYNFTIDIWSLGCVFYQILTKKKLFKSQNQLEQIKKIFQVTGTPQQDNTTLYNLCIKKLKLQPQQENWKEIQQQINDQKAFILLKNILNLNPKERPSINDILKNQYFS